MRKFVVSLSDQNMKHQLNSFAKEFDKWKGDFDQIDDICNWSRSLKINHIHFIRHSLYKVYHLPCPFFVKINLKISF